MTPAYELLEALESALDAHSIDADLDAEFEDDPDLLLGNDET
jgi:hypothetical protein